MANPNHPDYVHPSLARILPDLHLVADLLGGTTAMRARATTYIRKWTHEAAEVWQFRATCEQVFEGLSRILSAAVGMLFAKPPTLTWNAGAPEIEDHWANIDGMGTAGDVWVKRQADLAIRDGVVVALIDHPSRPVDEKGNPIPINFANQETLGLRPRWVGYARAAVLSWRFAVVGGVRRLVRLVLQEEEEVEDGAYGMKVQERYRVLDVVAGIASWNLLVRDDTLGAEFPFRSIAGGVYRNRDNATYDRLPVAIAHTGRSDGILESTIPLMGVAWANLAHYQLSSNLRFYAEIAAFPQPTVIGDIAPQTGPAGRVVPGVVRVGPLVVVHLQSGATFGYTTPPVEAFEPLTRLIEKKEWQMEKLGMTFLAPHTLQRETAEAKRIDATAQNASLATAAQGLDDYVNEAFVHHGWFLGLSPEQVPTFALNRDFESTTMDPATMVAYVTAVDKAGLPVSLLLQAWQAGGRIPMDVDLEQLELTMMAAAESREEARAQEEEARQATQQEDLANLTPGRPVQA